MEQPLEMRRNALYNLEEIKVRWKKAALENCPGVPCIIIPPPPSFTCGNSTISDIDNNSYNTVLIGTQCWTKENLKVTNYNDGTAIPLNNTYTSGTVSTVWQGLTTGAYTIYGNESSIGANATNYGFLYNWYAVNDTRKLCPSGWHVPTDAEWTILTDYLGGLSVAGGKLKSTGDNTAGTGLWNFPNTGADNTSGFSALPGGFRYSFGSFNDIRSTAFVWSATASGSSDAWYRVLPNNIADVLKLFNLKSVGASVRCLRD
jgi:uncharacterized protein (TIGR02145 family)